jgi:hypothetical protein
VCEGDGGRGVDKQHMLSGVQAAEKSLISYFRSVAWRASMLAAEAGGRRAAAVVYFILLGEFRRMRVLASD